MACHSRGFEANRFKIASAFFITYLYLFAVGTILVAVFLFVAPASAQESPEDQSQIENETEITTEITAEVETDADTPVGVSEEVIFDETVTTADLEAEDSLILQDNPLYGLKRFGRGLRKAFTFNKQKKAELENKYANQELADVQKLVETKGYNEETLEKITEAVEKFEEGLEKAKDRSAEAQENEQDTAKFAHQVLDKQIKQQKVLEHLEDGLRQNVSADLVAGAVDKIQETKDRSAASTAQILARVEGNTELLTEQIDSVLTGQRGGDFKDLRNLEVLKRVQEHVPEEARKAIEQAQENAFKRFNQNVDRLSEDQRGHRFESYVKHIGGDETRHLEIFDRLKQSEGLPEDLIKKVEAAKDIAAVRFKDRVEAIERDFGDEAFRERFRERAFARFRFDGPLQVQPGRDEGHPEGFVPQGPPPEIVERLRVLDDIRQRIDFDHEKVRAEFEAKHDEGIEKFKATFTDAGSEDQIKRFEELSKKMAENPDPTTFRLLKELEEEVKSDPTKREFIEKMEHQAKAEFVKKAQEKGERFFDQVISSNPQDIDIFKKLQQEFAQNPGVFLDPPGFGPPGVGPEGFGPPPFGQDGEFLPPQGFPGQTENLPEDFDPGQFGPPPGFGPGSFGPPPGFANVFEQIIGRHTQNLTEQVRDIKDPELFENFQKKFNKGSIDIVEEIRLRQSGFEEVFRDKLRFVNEQTLERDQIDNEDRQRLEEERRRAEEEFRRRLESIGDNSEERARIEAERRESEARLDEKELEFKRNAFNERLRFDPFCDEQCQREEEQVFENFVTEKQRLMREMFEGGIPPGFGPDGEGPVPFGPDGEFFPPGEGPDGSGPPPFSGFDPRQQGRSVNNDQPAQSDVRNVDGFEVPSIIPDHRVEEFVNRKKQEERARQIQESGEFDPGGVLLRDDQRKPEPTELKTDAQRPEPQHFNEFSRSEGNEPLSAPDDFRQRVPDGDRFSEFQNPPQGFEPPPNFRDSGSNFQPPSDFQPPSNFQPPSDFQRPPEGTNFSPPLDFQGFTPQNAPAGPSAKVFNLLSSFFGLSNVFASVGW